MRDAAELHAEGTINKKCTYVLKLPLFNILDSFRLMIVLNELYVIPLILFTSRRERSYAL